MSLLELFLMSCEMVAQMVAVFLPILAFAYGVSRIAIKGIEKGWW